MGFWKAVHYALDPKAAAELDKRHAQRYREPSLLSELFANRRASRWSNQYWRDNRIINGASTPLSHFNRPSRSEPERQPLATGPLHRVGCSCRWCQGW